MRGKCQYAAGRLQGVVAETRSRLASHPIDDARLYERIRARLGHLADHAGAVEVEVRDGEVKLSGEVSEAEAQSVPRALGRMPGAQDRETVAGLFTAFEQSDQPGGVVVLHQDIGGEQRHGVRGVGHEVHLVPRERRVGTDAPDLICGPCPGDGRVATGSGPIVTLAY